MGRYLLFGFNNYLAKGGWSDYLLADDDIKNLIAYVRVYNDDETGKRMYAINNKFYDEIQLVDKTFGNIIYIEFKQKKEKSK